MVRLIAFCFFIMAASGLDLVELRQQKAGSSTTNPIAVLNTDQGTMKVELLLDKAPITVSNFIDLAKSGFYNGLHFHRVIPGFMDQFGCPLSRNADSGMAGTGGPDGNTEFKNLVTSETMQRDGGGNIQDECPTSLGNEQGTLSMANTGQPNSGGSQFFINVHDNHYLDCFNSETSSNHPVFGKIIDGYDVAVKISKVQTKNDNPRVPIEMKSIEIQ